MAVQLPGKNVNPEGADLSEPLKQLLSDLNLLEPSTQPTDGVGVTGTPYSLQVIRAGALALNKAWATIAGLAGVSGLITAIGGAWQADHAGSRVALIAGGSFITAAAFVAVALIVRGDVGARAATTVAQYHARAAVAISFLAAAKGAGEAATPGATGGSAAEDLLAALALHPSSVEAQAGGQFFGVRGIRRLAGKERQVKNPDGDWIGFSEIEGFRVERP